MKYVERVVKKSGIEVNSSIRECFSLKEKSLVGTSWSGAWVDCVFTWDDLHECVRAEACDFEIRRWIACG